MFELVFWWSNSSGALTDTYTYTPYGKLSSHEGTSENSFLFTGEQYDPEAGLYYLRARYYSPELARFLSRDTFEGTLTDPLSQNRYLYARGNPAVYVDPSGHMSMLDVTNTLAIMGTLSGIGTSLISTNNFTSGSYMRCWLKCVQSHNPLHPAFTTIFAISGAPIPKSWLKAMGLRVIILPGGSQYTTLSSALSVILKQGGASLLRGLGKGSYYGVLVYGIYMDILQGACLTHCASSTCKE